MDDLRQHSGQSSATLEQSEEKRRAKDSAISRLRDDVTFAKNKIDQLEDEAVNQTQKFNRDLNRVKFDLENAKAERDVAVKERRELEEKFESVSAKLQSQLAIEEARATELQKLLSAERTLRESEAQQVL